LARPNTVQETTATFGQRPSYLHLDTWAGVLDQLQQLHKTATLNLQRMHRRQLVRKSYSSLLITILITQICVMPGSL
jgi:hypothetical protein